MTLLCLPQACVVLRQHTWLSFMCRREWLEKAYSHMCFASPTQHGRVLAVNSVATGSAYP